MQKIDKKVKTLFWVALGLSIGFPVGVICIVLGAVNGIWVLLGLGIALAVAGFYVMPIMWIQYGEKKQHKILQMMIEQEHLYSVDELATQMGQKPEKITQMIKYLINSRCLVGYIFKDGILELNTNQKQTARTKETKKCPNCGANMTSNSINYVCQYCGTSQKRG